jgi:hypothetical protein
MPMPPYSIPCQTHGCDQLAQYKIAARWSDGITGELKTYALTCPVCLPEAFRQSVLKQASCRLAPNEILEPPGIYALMRGRRDAQIERLSALEEQLRGSGQELASGES